MGRIDLNAAREEARGKSSPHEAVLGEGTFQVPQLEEWPLRATDLLAEGRNSEALRIVLGDQWPLFKAQDPKLGDCRRLVDMVVEDQGLGSVGNSSSSSDSARSTGRGSKRTSSSTTK